ncbi:MAG TPA: hypothetical protein VD931_11210, partial [Baekduia sp.]|nr:hypothetical protein [Baekduia sp.]
MRIRARRLLTLAACAGAVLAVPPGAAAQRPVCTVPILCRPAPPPAPAPPPPDPTPRPPEPGPDAPPPARTLPPMLPVGFDLASPDAPVTWLGPLRGASKRGTP